MLRWLKYNAVGTFGVGIHLGLLALFVHVVGMHYLWATALSIEAAILQKYFWHWRWTWADRFKGTPSSAGKVLIKFNLLSLVSLGGNVLWTWFVTGFWSLDPVLANLLFIPPASLANFLITDKFVFVARGCRHRRGDHEQENGVPISEKCCVP